MNEKTYLVTGASGFIGKEICRVLISEGYTVNAVIRSYDDELTEMGVKCFCGDLNEDRILQDSITSADVIIHCAGTAKFGNGPAYKSENEDLTIKISQKIQEIDSNKLLIYLSTIGAVDRSKKDNCGLPLNEDSKEFPSSDYGISKLNAEKFLKKSDAKHIIVRPSMVVGKTMRIDSHFSYFAQQAIKKSLFSFFKWPGSFSIIHVNDLANAVLYLSRKEEALNGTYFCSGEQIELGEFIKSCNPNHFFLPLGLLFNILKLFHKFIPFSVKALILPALVADDSKLRNLGWSHTIKAEKALEEVIYREKTRRDVNLAPLGKTVITGAASGLGRSLALTLAEKRSDLLLIDKDEENLKKLKDKLKNSSFIKADLSKEEDINKLFKSQEWLTGSIAEIFLCAGIGKRGKIQDLSFEEHKKMFSINVLARIFLGQKAIERMKRNKFGRVVLISSSSAFQAMPYMATYGATNSALLSIGESWAEEEKDKSIRIMTVCPGGMQTNFQSSGGVKKNANESLMSPKKVAIEILNGLQKNKRVLVVSIRSRAMLIASKFLPRRLLNKLWGFLMEKLR